MAIEPPLKFAALHIFDIFNGQVMAENDDSWGKQRGLIDCRLQAISNRRNMLRTELLRRLAAC
jgi:hypothetical protein